MPALCSSLGLAAPSGIIYTRDQGNCKISICRYYSELLLLFTFFSPQPIVLLASVFGLVSSTIFFSEGDPPDQDRIMESYDHRCKMLK